MTDWNRREIGYPSQLGILLGLTGAGLIISAIISFAIWMMMVGGSFPSETKDLLQPKYYDVNMVIQGVSTFFIFFLPIIIYARISYHRPNDFLGFNSRFNNAQVLLVCAILLMAIPVSGAMAELNKIIPLPQKWELKFKAMEAARHAEEAAFIKIDSLHKYIISLFMIGLLPAIFEETYFRGGLQNLLTRWFRGPWIAIIITSIIFSMIHLSYYGFLVRFGLGVILGLLFHYSKNLWLPILFHLLFNGLQVTVMYILTRRGIAKPTEIEETFPVWLGIGGLFILIFLFVVYKKKSDEVQLKYAGEPDEGSFQPKTETKNNGI